MKEKGIIGLNYYSSFVNKMKGRAKPRSFKFTAFVLGQSESKWSET